MFLNAHWFDTYVWYQPGWPMFSSLLPNPCFFTFFLSSSTPSPALFGLFSPTPALSSLLSSPYPLFFSTFSSPPPLPYSFLSPPLPLSPVLPPLSPLRQVLGVHLNKWVLDRRLGLVCLLMYAVFLCFSILIEFNVFTFVNLPTCRRIL